MNAVLRPRSRRRLSRLARHVVSPALFDFWASRLHPTWSWDRALARVVARRVESRDSVTLVLAPNRHWRGLQAGQHLNVSAEIDGTRVTRSYSPTRVTGRGRRIEITVKAIAGGKMSQHLCDPARIGDVLELGTAFGDMSWPIAAPGGALLLAAGSGITPLIAMIRASAERGLDAPLTLLYWARCRDELCFVAELRDLAARHPAFQVRFVLTREAAAEADEAEGRIDAAQLAHLVSDSDQRAIYACGPGGFVETARSLLAQRAPAFLAEAFTPPPSLVDESGTVQLTLAASRRTLTVARGESLLKALESAGIKPPSGCRMGICNTCACGKREGSTLHLHNGQVEHEPVSALKLCVHSARTDLILDL